MGRAELIEKLMRCKWDCDEHVEHNVIALYYELDGFEGMRNYLRNELNTIGEKEFDEYYSPELFDILDELIGMHLGNVDIFEYAPFYGVGDKNRVLIRNYEMLKHHNMLKYYRTFYTGFRGLITDIIIVEDKYTIFVTKAPVEGNQYYIKDKFSDAYTSLELALLAAIFDGQYLDTLNVLLTSTKE